jgi:hypothetical protein
MSTPRCIAGRLESAALQHWLGRIFRVAAVFQRFLAEQEPRTGAGDDFSDVGAFAAQAVHRFVAGVGPGVS